MSQLSDPPADDSPIAPPVVVVMVTCVAGDWLEEALAGLVAQDYPNLTVVVIDASGDVDPTARVAAVLPTAFVRRLDHAAGYAAAANEALQVVEGASHLVVCHDDVVLAPDAVRLLVEEAFRSNAGVVTPKFVEWDRPDRLLQVGMSADRFGTPVPIVERGELDQEQHDGVRDVFVAPGACLLVRADLFATLGGFDPAMSLLGEDLDLSWRVHLAGARVVVEPAARVRHLEALTTGRRGRGPAGPAPDAGELERLGARHRLRALLKDQGAARLLLVVPQAIVVTLVRMVVGVATGRPGQARAAAGAWAWNLRRLGSIYRDRRALRVVRSVPDREIRRLQVRARSALSDYVRARMASRWAQPAAAPALATPVDAGEAPLSLWRLPLTVWGVIALVASVGSRQLIRSPLPLVGQLAPLPHSAVTMLRLFASGWRPDGLGSAAPAPYAFGLLGVTGALLGGAMGLLQKVVVLGAIPVGIAGAYRVARPLASERARLAAVAVYALVPVPYNALANGHWTALLIYAAMPWLLGRLLAATAISPYARDGETLAGQIVPLALLTALVAAFVPVMLIGVPILALALVAGGALAGGTGAVGRAGGVRAFAVAVAASAGAAVLLLPWSFDVLRAPGEGLFGVARAPATGYGLGALLRFSSGPVGAGPLGWAFLAAAALPLAIGRSWRLGWAIRLWFVAIAGWGLAWAGGRGWVPTVAAEVLLVPAAVAIALAVALGVAAIEEDLAGFRFGWRQAAPFVALGAAVVGVLPTVAAATNGRWYAPQQDVGQALAWMPDHRAEGAFRVLWVGDPQVLPLAGWKLQRGFAYGTSDGGVPDARYALPPSRPGAAGQLVGDLTLARSGRTTRLGHLLAPLAVRYLVLPLRPAPGARQGRMLEPPADLLAALGTQVDLRSVNTDPSLVVYENTAWGPGRELLPAAAAGPSHGAGPAAAQAAELAGATPVLVREPAPASARGPLPSAGDVYASVAASGGWQLKVAGRAMPRRTAFGWAIAFAAVAGPASLTFRTPLSRPFEILLVVALWVAALAWTIRGRPRRGPDHRVRP